jgi:hypothetical protein
VFVVPIELRQELTRLSIEQNNVMFDSPQVRLFAALWQYALVTKLDCMSGTRGQEPHYIHDYASMESPPLTSSTGNAHQRSHRGEGQTSWKAHLLSERWRRYSSLTGGRIHGNCGHDGEGWELSRPCSGGDMYVLGGKGPPIQHCQTSQFVLSYTRDLPVLIVCVRKQ